MAQVLCLAVPVVLALMGLWWLVWDVSTSRACWNAGYASYIRDAGEVHCVSKRPALTEIFPDATPLKDLQGK